MIPNIIHFIFGLSSDFGGKAFSLVHYLAIKSAAMVNRPKKIYFYYLHEPQGKLWEQIKPLLTLIKVAPPSEIFGNPVEHVAHKTDILRLEALLEHGGIYLDMDTICKKPFTDLLKHQVVMGLEALDQGKNIVGLCNGVILAKKNSDFLKKWYLMFKAFDQTKWNMHAVIVPYLLAQKFPEMIHIEPFNRFHYPTWDKQGLKTLFEQTAYFPESYVHHLWESHSWDNYLAKLSVDYINKVDTTYNVIARNFLEP